MVVFGSDNPTTNIFVRLNELGLFRSRTQGNYYLKDLSITRNPIMERLLEL